MTEKIQALLKQLPNRDLVGLRKKLSGKNPGLKIPALAATHKLLQASLEKLEAGNVTDAKLAEFMREVYIHELAKSAGILNCVSRLSLEMKQKADDLQKPEKVVPTPKPTGPLKPASKPKAPGVIKKPRQIKTVKAVTRAQPQSKPTKPVIKRHKRSAEREDKGLMILVAAGLEVSTTVSYDPGGMTIQVAGSRRVLNNLVVALKPRA